MDGRIEINIIQSSDPQRSYVVKCATLKCSFGDSESKLQTPDRKMASINGKHQGNIMDFKPMMHIMPFGMCSSLANPTVAAATAANYGKLQKMPCIPAVTMPWINGKATVMVDGFPALLNISQNMCLYSGVITIQNDGQAASMPASMPAITPNMDRVGVGVEKAANGGLLAMIGLGALAVGLTILTAPVSVPLLITAAAVGTVAAGGACVLMGSADIVEGGQDVAYGAVGSDQYAFNPIKDTVFMGDADAYYNAEFVASTAAMLGEATIAPYTLAVTGSEVGAKKAMSDRLASNKSAPKQAPPGKNVTTASKAQAEKPPASSVQSAKQTQSAETKPVVETKPTEPYNRRKHYGNTPKQSDRKAIGGESVDHDPPLVKRYYEGDPKTGEKPGYLQTPEERKASANDRSRMQPATKADQNKQGGEMSKYSKEQKKKYGLE